VALLWSERGWGRSEIWLCLTEDLSIISFFKDLIDF